MCTIVISGYFCTGKTSVMRILEEEFDLHKPKVYTTRAMRSGEKEGDPYTFITKEKFDQLGMIEGLFDPIKHAGNHYAADKTEIYGKDRWIIDILPDSWETYKQIPGVIGIYLIPPDKEVLKARAIARKDSPEAIEKRLQAIKDQDPTAYHYAIEPQSSLEELCDKIREIVKRIIEPPSH